MLRTEQGIKTYLRFLEKRKDPVMIENLDYLRRYDEGKLTEDELLELKLLEESINEDEK